MKVRALAPGKVNLALFLGEAREHDGRHELVTLFQSLSLADELLLETTDADTDEIVCPGVDGDNLAAAALAALRERGWDGPGIRISIAKRIPVAAGMAGGSADAAAAIRLAMSIAPGRAEEVDAVAARLGADVPSQLLPGLALGTGAGELVEHFEPLALHAFVIVPSAHALATPEVYREADRLGLPRTADDLQERYEQLCAALHPGARLPAELLVNDLAPAAISLCPAVADTLSDVQAAGAEHALVCGSGPTVAGIWWGPGAAAAATAAATALRDRHPGALAATPVTLEFAMPSVV
jgi:4-diphosphocytidyl-2-C-methyl-D-erythritol kinase